MKEFATFVVSLANDIKGSVETLSLTTCINIESGKLFR